ncbi:uncharacterized protein M6B38_108275 [Iris pallida]|uniref:Urease accessory protein UreH-like transmembrane domain-containing protein n=1 Tax=Iris pallida TaxID=29817 RepID=A0AAX6EHF1_IRIPA|nr:uncharacterized protein M6B38_108275 [Iris pallida]
MERLISTSSSSSLCFPKASRLLLLHGSSSSSARRSNLPVRLKLRSPSAASSSSSKHHDVTKTYNFPILPRCDDNDIKTTPTRHSAAAPLLQKVASAVAVVLLSASIVTLIQPMFAPLANATTVQSAVRTGGLVRTELLTSAWTGLFAGCLHTLSGPDHLAALAPLSIGRTSTESAIVGALWGCGHDAGQLIFGLLFLLLKDRLHIEVISSWGTIVVGLTLLVIGAMGIREALEVPAPCVALENGECDVSITLPLESAPSGKKKIGFATFATGVVHGLQPDALLIVLPALALPSRLAGASFLGMFLVGTVLAMGSYTAFIGSCSQALKERIPRITEKLTWAASLFAMSMGIAILISQFFGFSLY